MLKDTSSNNSFTEKNQYLKYMYIIRLPNEKSNSLMLVALFSVSLFINIKRVNIKL